MAGNAEFNQRVRRPPGDHRELLLRTNSNLEIDGATDGEMRLISINDARNAYEDLKIYGDNVNLNATELLSQAAAEQTALREELNKQLDEMLYSKLAETDKAMVDNTDSIVAKVPLKIFVG